MLWTGLMSRVTTPGINEQVRVAGQELRSRNWQKKRLNYRDKWNRKHKGTQNDDEKILNKSKHRS